MAALVVQVVKVALVMLLLCGQNNECATMINPVALAISLIGSKPSVVASSGFSSRAINAVILTVSTRLNAVTSAAKKGFTLCNRSRAINAVTSAAQKGFTLIEMSVVMLIVGILLSSYANLQQVQADDVDAKRVAEEILETHTALEGYATLYYDNLNSATPTNLLATNYSPFAANVYTPTFAELKAMGYLAKIQSDITSNQTTSYASAAPSGQPSKVGVWRFQINKIPAGCVDAGCDLELVTYIDQPVSRHNDGIADEGFLSKIASFGGSKIGYSTVNSPLVVSGPNSTWSIVNPISLPGILFARSTVNSLGLAHFSRVMDSRPLVVGGNLTVTGNSVFNDMSVTGAYNNVAPVSSVVGDGGGYVTSLGLVTGAHLIQNNIVATGNTGTIGSGMVSGNTNYAVPQQPCGPVGSTGVAVNGELYTCRYNVVIGGYWILASEPDCQIPGGASGAYTNFGVQSFIVTADQNIQIPNGCYYTKFTFSDASGSFAANDFMTFNRSSSLSGQIVQSYFTSVSANNALIMDRNQQIIAHQTALSNGSGASIKIKIDIAKD
jgi:prepilin-type N-terminal cleavage/methylation domain-containing protein